ncbi:HAD-IB family phosphatase [Tautonia marina]|uniref:HAD-IB family phosphatase n=1 Tax=Tautonia marina TaxID=2653855 RepID=UPI001260F8EF|nr:HAD-IB family phosphatase [Tautonia marina]
MRYPSILVTDFDGTLTSQDYYRLVRDRLVPDDTPDYWSLYRNGQLTHFEALRAYFAAARPDEPTHLALVDLMGLDPNLAQSVAALNEQGWKVVVVSNGCQWYIDRLLRQAGVDLEVHANPGALEGGRLAMHWPTDTLYPSKQTGIDKAAVIRAYLEEGRTVAFAGDGATDVAPALLVPPNRRFARADLAEGLREQNASFRPFERWSEVANALLESTGEAS